MELEAQAAGRAYRVLGERLASSGFLALQVDYDGTADSAGSDSDPGRVAAWQASVRSAVEFLRSAGAQRVSVIAMRLGATVAASVARDCDLEALVLWDPCESGRAFLREQTLLRSVYLNSQGLGPKYGTGYLDDGAVETLGTLYSTATVTELTDLKLSACPAPWAPRVLALFHPQRPARNALREYLSAARVELDVAAEVEDVTSAWPLEALVPDETLGKIVSWLTAVSGANKSRVTVSLDLEAIVSTQDGDVLEEIAYLGPHRLFTVLTRPLASSGGATVVMLNSGRIDHTGPGRLWVELARQWAGAGIRVARADLSGLGDSPPRAGSANDVARPPSATQDIDEIARALCPQDTSEVILMGLCSGAHLAVEAALTSSVGGVVALNVVFPIPPAPAAYENGEPGGAKGAPTHLARLAVRLRKAGSHLPGHHLLGGLGRRASDVKWWFLHHVMGRPAPAFELERLAVRGVSTLVICGSYEGRLLQLGEALGLARAQRGHDFRLHIFPDIDHTLFTQQTRRKVLPIVTEWTLQRSFGMAQEPSRAASATASSAP
jgi:alpha-beta hydrolase superfamily lysophospholipase